MADKENTTCITFQLYIRGMLISWVRANHEIHEIKTPRIFCRFTVLNAWNVLICRKMPIKEFYLDRVLEGLGLSQDEVGIVNRPNLKLHARVSKYH